MKKIYEISRVPRTFIIGGRVTGTLPCRTLYPSSEDERREIMEKYGVKVDPKKVEQEKVAGAGSKKPSPVSPHRNVPMDPDRGTEPFESEPGSATKKD